MNIDGLFSYVADAAGIRNRRSTRRLTTSSTKSDPGGLRKVKPSAAADCGAWHHLAGRERPSTSGRRTCEWLGRPMIFNRSNWGLADSSCARDDPLAASSTATLIMCGIVGSFQPGGAGAAIRTSSRGCATAWRIAARTASASGCRAIASARSATGGCRSSICPTSPRSRCRTAPAR